MKVKELINTLNMLDPEHEVYVEHEAEGFPEAYLKPEIATTTFKIESGNVPTKVFKSDGITRKTKQIKAFNGVDYSSYPPRVVEFIQDDEYTVTMIPIVLIK